MEELLTSSASPAESKSGREVLDELWKAALDAQAARPDDGEQRQEAAALDAEAEALLRSRIKSIRYAAITQLLGKALDPEVDVHALQKGKEGSEAPPGAWNARSLCDGTVVPWEQENEQMLGGSAEPYANNPLRVAKLERERKDVRQVQDWTALYDFLEKARDGETARRMLGECMKVCAQLAREQRVSYRVRGRVDLPMAVKMIGCFLRKQSGGMRPLVVATAVLRTIGRHTRLWDRVESQGINEADAASKKAGDVTCYLEEKAVLCAEVKDMQLRIGDLRQSVAKTLGQEAPGAKTLWMATEGVEDKDAKAIEDKCRKEWAGGLNIHQASIREVVKMVFILLPEGARPELLREIGVELDHRKVHKDRQEWRDILEKEA